MPVRPTQIMDQPRELVCLLKGLLLVINLNRLRGRFQRQWNGGAVAGYQYSAQHLESTSKPTREHT